MPSLTMKQSSVPDTIAGMIKGNITVNSDENALAPELSAACSRLGSMLHNAEPVKIIIDAPT
jgi:hypothetical protein